MDVREGLLAVRNHGPTGGGTMQMATTLRRSTYTFLTHLFGPGTSVKYFLLRYGLLQRISQSVIKPKPVSF